MVTVLSSPCSQVSLEELCREEGLPWLERESTKSERDTFKSVPRKHDGLRDGLLELMSLCQEAREVVHPQGSVHI